MDIGRARTLLGVTAAADESVLRSAHRSRIRRAHPDAGGSDGAAAELNEALALLLDPRAPAPPAEPARATPTPAPIPTDLEDADRVFVVEDPAEDLLLRLAEAGHTVGEVVFVDPHVGMLEIVVGEAPAVGQLAVTVGAPNRSGTPVSFTLEPLGVTPAPPIGDVVTALMAAVRR